MKKIIFFLHFSLIAYCSLAQNNNPLKNIKNDNLSKDLHEDVEALTDRTQDEFLILINDTNTKLHQELQNLLDDYRSIKDNIEYFVYPSKVSKDNLTIQFLNYSVGWGFLELNQSNTFRNEVLDCLIFLPVSENVHNGTVINNICFKARLKKYIEQDGGGRIIKETINLISVERVNW